MTIHPRFGERADAVLRGAELGAKGAWLHWLARRGVPVPAGFVVPVASLESLSKDPATDAALGVAVESLVADLGHAGTLAVRASPVESQPGALPTLLGVRGYDEVVAALRMLREAALAAGTACAAVVQHEVATGPDGFSAAAFTREPSRGAPGVVGEWSAGGPGSDVMGGRTRLPSLSQGPRSLRALRPAPYEDLRTLAAQVEHASGRILELELVHDGTRLWAVQARPVPRHGLAAVRLSVERLTADPRCWVDLHPEDARSLWVEHVAGDRAQLARGLAASPGIAVGLPVGSPAEVERRAAAGEAVLLVRAHASPEDVPAMRVAAGVLTSAGGITCHAAVMARGLGKPAVVSCEGLEATDAEVRLHGRTLSPDEFLSVDGGSGCVYAGQVETLRLPGGHGVQRLLELLRERRHIPLWLSDADGLGEQEIARLAADGRFVEGGTPVDRVVILRGAPEAANLLSAIEREAVLVVDARFFLAWAVAVDAVSHPGDPGPGS